MRDRRWQDALTSADWAAFHFSKAKEILDSGNLIDQLGSDYMPIMGFFHALQSGHTAVEEALIRILQTLGEKIPAGESWHAELLNKCATAAPNRPPILSKELLAAAQQTRAFRHRATRATVQFDFMFSKDRARVAVSAGDVIATQLKPAILSLMASLDQSR